jgi:hypothetical protein
LFKIKAFNDPDASLEQYPVRLGATSLPMSDGKVIDPDGSNPSFGQITCCVRRYVDEIRLKLGDPP